MCESVLLFVIGIVNVSERWRFWKFLELCRKGDDKRGVVRSVVYVVCG